MLTDNITAILAAHATLQQQMQPALAALKDTAIPLDERWTAFTSLIEANLLVNEQSYGDGYLGELFGHHAVSLYDDFMMERGQTMTFPEMWEAMHDEFFSGGEVYNNDDLKNQWRERVLLSGFSSFCHDW